LTLAVTRIDGAYRIEGGARPAAVEFHVGAVIEDLAERADEEALARADCDLVLPGLLADLPGGRTLVVTEQSEARALLARRLLHDGLALDGARLVAFADSLATSLVSPVIFGRDPGEPSQGIERIVAGGGRAGWAMRPDALGRPWRIATAAVTEIVDLRPDGGSTPRVTDLSRWETAALLGGRRIPSGAPGRGAAALARLVDGARCRRVVCDGIDQGAHVLRSLSSVSG
jgi:hypothetical protein